MKKENKLTINNLIYALLFLLFGILLLTRFDLITIASKVIGIILIIIGIVKSIIYIYMKGKVGNYPIYDLVKGLLLVGCGLLLLLNAAALGFAIRTIIGFWVLFSGINRIVLAISIKTMDKAGFRVYLTTSILMIIIGFCVFSGLVDKIIGIFVIGYSITEIINYIYFKVNYKNDDIKTKESKTKSKSKMKRLKESKVVEAVIEEEKN